MAPWIVYAFVVCAIILCIRTCAIQLNKQQVSHLRDEAKSPLLRNFHAVNIM